MLSPAKILVVNFAEFLLFMISLTKFINFYSLKRKALLTFSIIHWFSISLIIAP